MVGCDNAAMPDAPATGPAWTVSPEPVGSPESAALFRDYYVEVSDRYFQLHEGRASTAAEIEQGLAEESDEGLAAPTGAFLVARHGSEASGCVGFRMLDAGTAELTRMYVRPALRGRGCGGRLLTAVEEAARGFGARRVVLDTRHDLLEARALYTRHGYREVTPHNDAPYAERWFAKDL